MSDFEKIIYLERDNTIELSNKSLREKAELAKKICEDSFTIDLSIPKPHLNIEDVEKISISEMSKILNETENKIVKNLTNEKKKNSRRTSKKSPI